MVVTGISPNLKDSFCISSKKIDLSEFQHKIPGSNQLTQKKEYNKEEVFKEYMTYTSPSTLCLEDPDCESSISETC